MIYGFQWWELAAVVGWWGFVIAGFFIRPKEGDPPMYIRGGEELTEEEYYLAEERDRELWADIARFFTRPWMGLKAILKKIKVMP
ncbi:MAG TPA: hypothetical protein VF475_09060 [Sphingobium sp.]